jgi:hypothetical protein
MRPRVPGETFESMVRKDARVLKMHRYDQAGHYKMPFRKMTQHILDLQANRRHRLIGVTDILPDAQTKVIDWSTGMSATFSRVNKIRMHAFAKKRLLDEHLKTVRKYLMEEYGAYLKAEISTIKGREYAAKEALRYFEDLSFRLESLILLSDMLIQELDKSGFSVNHSIQAIQLSSRPERNI